MIEGTERKGTPTINASSVEMHPYPVAVGTAPVVDVRIDDAESASVVVDPRSEDETATVPLRNVAGNRWTADLENAAVLDDLDAGTEVDLTIRARNEAGTVTLDRFADEIVPDTPAPDADLDYYLFEQIRDAAIVVGDVPSNSITGADLPGPRARRNWRFGKEVYVNNYYGSGNGSMGAVGFDMTLYTNGGRLYTVDRSRDHDERGYETASHVQFPVDLRRAADDVPYEQYDLWIASHPGEKLGRGFFCPRLPEQGWSGWGCDISESGLRTVYVTATGLVDERGHYNDTWLHELGHDRGFRDLYEYDASIVTLMGNGAAGAEIGILSRLGMNDGPWEPSVSWLNRDPIAVPDLPRDGRTLTIQRLQTLDIGDEVPVIEERTTDGTFDTRATYVLDYRYPMRSDDSAVFLYRVAPRTSGGTDRELIGSLAEVGAQFETPLDIHSPAYLRFRLTDRDTGEAEVTVRRTAGRANTKTVVLTDRTAVTKSDRLVVTPGRETSRPDLDLIAVDEQGRRVGVTANGTYVTEIPGARASGDQDGREWISVPDDVDVQFRVRSEDVATYLATTATSRENVTLAYRTAVTHYGENPRVVRRSGGYAVTNTTTVVSDNRTLSPGASAPAVHAAVVAAATVSPNRTEPGETVTLDATPSFGLDSTIEQYEWDFDGDGTVDATGRRVRTSFDDSGTQEVSLVVTGADGATDATNVTVAVAADESDDGDDDTSTSSGPGFGVAAAVVALLALVAVGRR